MKTKSILFAAYGVEDETMRENTIGKLSAAAASLYPDYELRVSFTSERMIQRAAEKGAAIQNVSDTLKALSKSGVKEVVLQPLHIIYGSDYDRMTHAIQELGGLFESVKLGKPFLADTADYFKICELLKRVYPVGEEDCLVLAGHGASHYANASYAALAYTLQQRGCKNIFVGALEAYPGIDVIQKEVDAYHPKKVKLAPFLFAAARHAQVDMAGERETSWKSQIEKLGYPVEMIPKGLADAAEFRGIFMDHLATAMRSE